MAHHDHDHAEYQVGTMDITEQQKTFAGFIKLSIWTACAAVVVLIFLALVNS